LNRDEEDDEVMDRSFESVKSKRGRPAIPDRWTRVFEIKQVDETPFKLHVVATELLLENAMPSVSRRER
jgi:hypothetical protein